MPKRRMFVIFHVLLLAALALLLWGFSGPWIDIPAVGASVVALLGLGAGWLVLVTRTRSWWTAAAPVLLVAAVLLVNADVPREVRWSCGAGAFNAFVADLPAPADPTDLPAWDGFTGGRDFGCYTIREAYAVEGGYAFHLDVGGFVYQPHGTTYWTAVPGPAGPRALGDGWYSFVDEF
ncbi:hypothetical protein Afil01_50790 [Actinorhabdospora filicis]|uniref:Uncharacterized protein n=1 Tax=Actinorhabdospora filicis TaxID=1785913 RepID=A0A9W6W5D8_9ACTN|nr:hypothetical protein [Actinorhabdospora filicis]GLZ80272.1 hypothetical protein Afil01_50790 [Actinorhabdospora filicis]